MTQPLWISLDGAVNVRDVGGLPAGSRRTRPGRLIRSDNLQDLSAADIRELVGRRHVTTVVDLRTEIEVRSEGPGPLDRDGRVRIHRLSLFPAAGHNTDVTAVGDDEPVMLPWHTANTVTRERREAAHTYLRYLADRPDSAVEALRLIAHTDGVTIVHCAAGKDRTGVVVALALDEAGVDREAIIEDFARSAERLMPIVRRLARTSTYAQDIDTVDPSRHTPRRETLEQTLAVLDADWGGTAGWLRAHGWTERDAAALRAALLDGSPA
jgi:protein-tyrosine phosphatase